MSSQTNAHDIHPVTFGVGFFLHIFELLYKHPLSHLNSTFFEIFLGFQGLLLVEWGLTPQETQQVWQLGGDLLEKSELALWRNRYQEAALHFAQNNPSYAALWMRQAIATLTLQYWLIERVHPWPTSPSGPQKVVLAHWRQTFRLDDDHLWKRITEQGVSQGNAAFLFRTIGSAK